MKIYSRLLQDRQAEGIIWWVVPAPPVPGANHTNEVIVGPYRARGEADNSGAKAHGNVQEDPTRAYGDHPSGLYRVAVIKTDPSPLRSYGPRFLLLDPLNGEALQAEQNGRVGLGIHGGDLGPDGSLRATFGCLRAENAVIIALANAVQGELAAGHRVLYECEILDTE